jgi:hypothetical protein
LNGRSGSVSDGRSSQMSDVMIKAMVLEAPNRPLHLRERPMPEPTGSQLLIGQRLRCVSHRPPSARR